MTYDIRMSVEDAVEIVLKDETLDICVKCKGVGWIENEPDTPKSLVAGGFLAHKCPQCHGHVASFKAEYIEACVVLGKEVPKLTDYVTVERMQKNPNYNPLGIKLYDMQPTRTMTIGSRSPNVQNLPSPRYMRALPRALEQWTRGGVVKIDT
jgi:hypothetical protein